jgi:hypothetical protein
MKRKKSLLSRYNYDEFVPEKFELWLTSTDQKFEHARHLRDKLAVNRPILLTALDGACHRAYGSMPNMSWIFNKAGIPTYKSDWTDARSLDTASEYFLDVLQRRRSGERFARFQVERLDFRTPDPSVGIIFIRINRFPKGYPRFLNSIHK